MREVPIRGRRLFSGESPSGTAGRAPVLFSATTYPGGHGALVAGVRSGHRDLIEEIRWCRDTTGPAADGDVAFLLRRSLTLLPTSSSDA
jgi:cystathionine beta-lyase/cystathionine gamma-synthase